MNGLFVEKYSLEGKPLSRQLACHVCSHGLTGKIAVVTDRPRELLAATRKQWARLIRLAQNERSSARNPTRVDALNGQILWMQGLTFSSKIPDDSLEADITFATADDFVLVPPVCRCIYITYAFDREKLYMLTGWMPKSGLVVVYEQE